jgi:hypothetical protein
MNGHTDDTDCPCEPTVIPVEGAEADLVVHHDLSDPNPRSGESTMDKFQRYIAEMMEEDPELFHRLAKGAKPPPRQLDHLICPTCHSARIGVLRDMRSTRVCADCHRHWLPHQDPPQAGGPYVASWVKAQEEHTARVKDAFDRVIRESQADPTNIEESGPAGA